MANAEENECVLEEGTWGHSRWWPENQMMPSSRNGQRTSRLLFAASLYDVYYV